MNTLDVTRIDANELLDLRPVTTHAGVEIAGIDLAEPQPPEVYAAIRRAVADYGVAFFRGQRMSPADHDRLAHNFGKVKKVRFVSTVEGYPHMSEVRKEENQTRNIGGSWHTDGSFYEEPPMGSILVARELPSVGGDTLFLNMAAVYEALTPGLQETLSGLRAVHSNELYKMNGGGKAGLINTDADVQYATHPVVVTHPVNGRKCLYVNSAYTRHFEGWSVAESKPLLDYIYNFAPQAEFFCRFHWEEGSVAFWDNITAWHYATNDYQGERRLMHRITFEGGRLN